MELTPISQGKEVCDEQIWGVRPVLWGLRILEPDIPAMLRSLSPDERRETATFLGLTFPAEIEGKGDAERLSALVAERRRALDGTAAGSVLYGNLHHLQRALDLNDTELDLIAFRAMLRLHPGFEALARKYIGHCVDFVFHRKLARMLAVPDSSVSAALAPLGQLVKSGLVTVASGVVGPLENRIRVLPGLISPLTAQVTSPAELVTSLLPRPRRGQLELSAFPHLAREITLLSSHLRNSIALHAAGTNVLLYGAPGTGKTELAAAIAASLNYPLYVSAAVAEDGKSLAPRDRVRQLIQLQKLVRMTDRGIVLVDEVEDLFPTALSDPEKVPTKATVNECLETNPAPTIWITNRTRHMDEAFLRRFDLIVHVSQLPASAKRKLLRDLLPPGTLGRSEMQLYAERRELSPAMITRMARVATSDGVTDSCTLRDNLRILTGHYLRTLGTRPVPAMHPSASLKHDPELLNTAPRPDVVLDAMIGSQLSARMLLHGKPGTGKTALAHEIAERLDRPLLQRRASSLLSKYVGETEHNLRDMFDEARREGGVLLLDEADSFLRSRDHARAQWEVTQTNELLTQMEEFDGVLICTTNRLDDIDPAALRRFDFKVAFSPLRPEQRLRLVHQCCAALGLDARGDEWMTQIRARQLDGLTPGDAAAALRRLRLSGDLPALAVLLDALADECRYKVGSSTPMGFVH